MPNYHEWIDVNDMLPDKNSEVLVYRGMFIGSLMNVYTYLGNNEWEDDYGYWCKTSDEGITHRMPLPASPIERKNY